MQEIPRAILLPPPSPPPQRPSARAADAGADPHAAGRSARRQDGASQGTGQGTGHAFLAVLERPREDTVELKGKPFRFRPYGNRGAAGDEVARGGLADNGIATLDETGSDGEIAIDLFGPDAQGRNSSAFIAGFIAQERLRRGLHNPPHLAASDAYRRAGGSPSAIDGQPRVFSFAV
jgi:hypothetical protein